MKHYDPITFRFDEEKAAAAAGLFIACSGLDGVSINYLKLLKLMYLLDRTALIKWGQPVVGGSYASMDFGPTPLDVYRLILNKNEGKGRWDKLISRPEDFTVSLKARPSGECLNQAETKLLSEIVEKYGHYTEWELSKLLHRPDVCPEWRDPDGASIPINCESILKAADKRPDEIFQIKKDSQETEFLESLFRGE